MAIETNADVASKVRGLAAERRISHAALADNLGLSRMAMSRRLSGAVPLTPEELIQLARQLDVPAGVLLGSEVAA